MNLIGSLFAITIIDDDFIAKSETIKFIIIKDTKEREQYKNENLNFSNFCPRLWATGLAVADIVGWVFDLVRLLLGGRGLLDHNGIGFFEKRHVDDGETAEKANETPDDSPDDDSSCSCRNCVCSICISFCRIVAFVR